MPASPVWLYQMKCPTCQNNARPIGDALINSQPTWWWENCSGADSGNLHGHDLTLRLHIITSHNFHSPQYSELIKNILALYTLVKSTTKNHWCNKSYLMMLTPVGMISSHQRLRWHQKKNQSLLSMTAEQNEQGAPPNLILSKIHVIVATIIILVHVLFIIAQT